MVAPVRPDREEANREVTPVPMACLILEEVVVGRRESAREGTARTANASKSFSKQTLVCQGGVD